MTVVAGRGRWPLMGGSRVNRHNVTGLTGNTAPAPIPTPTPMLAEYAFDPTTDFPDLITEFSPSTDPLALPTWSRLHDSHRGVNRLSSLTTDTGRQRETDRFQPGTASHEFDNHDRVLDPKYSTGPYFGYLDPGNRIRDRAVWGSRTYELYTGFVLGYHQRHRPPASATATAAATDLLDILSGEDVPSSPYAAEIIGDAFLHAWWRLGESAGLAALDSGPNRYDGSNVNSPVLGAPGLIPADSDTAYQFTGSSWIVVGAQAALTGTQFAVEALLTHAAATRAEFVIVQSGFAGSYGIGLGTPHSYFHSWSLQINADGTITGGVDNSRVAGDVVLTSSATVTSGARVDDGAVHHVQLTRDHLSVTLAVDGVAVANGLLTYDDVLAAGGITIAATSSPSPTSTYNGVLDEIALYDNAQGATKAKAHVDARNGWLGDSTGARAHRIANLVGILQTERSIDTGLTTMGAAALSGSELGYLQLLEATEQGQLLVDHDNGGQLRFADRYRRLLEIVSTVPQAVFTDDPTSTTGYRYEPDGLVVTRDKQLVFNDITVTWVGGSARCQDATSRRRYGHRSRTINTELPTADQAGSLGRWFLSHYKDPIDRILSLTLKPSADKRLFDVALGLKVGHLVTFELQPQGIGNRSSQNVIVEGKHGQWGSGVNEATFVLYVSNADVRSYFRPGISSPGGDGPAY